MCGAVIPADTHHLALRVEDEAEEAPVVRVETWEVMCRDCSIAAWSTVHSPTAAALARVTRATRLMPNRRMASRLMAGVGQLQGVGDAGKGSIMASAARGMLIRRLLRNRSNTSTTKCLRPTIWLLGVGAAGEAVAGEVEVLGRGAEWPAKRLRLRNRTRLRNGHIVVYDVDKSYSLGWWQTWRAKRRLCVCQGQICL